MLQIKHTFSKKETPTNKKEQNVLSCTKVTKIIAFE